MQTTGRFIDAFVLADSLRHEHQHWRPLHAPSSELAELKALVRDRLRILELQQVVEAQLRATLDTYHPAPARLFTTIDRQITLDFIRDYPNPRAASHMAEGRMEQLLDRHSYTGRQPAAVLTDRLRVHLLEASPGTTAARQRTALAQVDQLELLNRQLKEFNNHIDNVLRRHPDHELFLSFPGVASITAAALLAEIGEHRDRFPAPAHLLAEAGLAPVSHPLIGAQHQSPVPLRRQRPTPRRLHVVGLHLHPNQPVGSRRLRRRQTTMTTSLPSPTRHRRPMGPRPLALLAGQSALRPDQARQRAALTTPHSTGPPGNASVSRVLEPGRLTMGVCRVDFARNLLARVPKAHQDMRRRVADRVRTPHRR